MKVGKMAETRVERMVGKSAGRKVALTVVKMEMKKAAQKEQKSVFLMAAPMVGRLAGQMVESMA